jgi:NAD(P)-dependent dehydrogenase (short-subunit alcohol dehydrogenase family)
MTPTSKQLLITGVSSGLGRAFAVKAVRVGHRVVGTVRTPEAAAAFEAAGDGRATAILLDVTDEQAILAAIAQVEQNQGPIDVLIASAGYGHEVPVPPPRRVAPGSTAGAPRVLVTCPPGRPERPSRRESPEHEPGAVCESATPP